MQDRTREKKKLSSDNALSHPEPSPGTLRLPHGQRRSSPDHRDQRKTPLAVSIPATRPQREKGRGDEGAGKGLGGRGAAADRPNSRLCHESSAAQGRLALVEWLAEVKEVGPVAVYG